MIAPWIKMRANLLESPQVIAIAAATGLEDYAVVGRLHRLWCWADANTTDGDAAHICAPARITFVWVDRYIHAPGFAAAMVAVGWLVEVEGGLVFPEFDEHMSNSAKKRAQHAKATAERRKCAPAKRTNVRSDAHAAAHQDEDEEEDSVEAEASPPSSPSSSSSGLGAPADDDDDDDENDQGAGLANLYLNRIRSEHGAHNDPMRSDDARAFIWRLGVLAARGEVITDAVVAEMLNQMRATKPEKPTGYLRQLVREHVESNGANLNAVLRAIELPEAVKNYRPKATA